jgi:DNA-binding response OmpR family regulator
VLVEPDDDLADVLRIILSTARYEIARVRSPGEVTDRARSGEPPDLVVLNAWRLREDAARALRRAAGGARLVVIIDGPLDPRVAEALRPAAVLPMPFEAAHLLAAVGPCS